MGAPREPGLLQCTYQLPLALGFFSVGLTGAGIFFLSQVTDMSVFVTNVASMIGIGVAKVNPQAVFGGKYFLMFFLALCVATVAVFLAQRRAPRKSL